MGEFPALCAAIYGGLLIGALYDALRPLRFFFKSRFWNGLLDAAYYVLVFCMVALLLFYINGGVPRFYLLLGICLGVYVYARFVSRFILAVAAKIKIMVAKRQGMD
ncbi:MAG: spore cortex biosynthesis protein YabQ [Candidatus Pelethousia sp.]|nr:spore cortex biosynthesis protein YabQ [Candidatus Pelethousia sp.]